MTKAPDRIWVSDIPWDLNRIDDLKAMGFAWNMAHGKDPQPYLISTPAREAAEELLEALEDMTNFYVELVSSGDCGRMDDAETEIEVLAARRNRQSKGGTQC